MAQSWDEYITTLPDKFDNLRSSDDEPGTPPIIATPIDKGAKALLERHSRSWLDYPALEVEYLVRTLNEHIRHCIEIREKAQDLEARAISETMEKELQIALFQILAQQADLAKANEPSLLGNLKGVRIENGQPVGEASDYWNKLTELQKTHLSQQENHARLRLEQMKEPGSGANYVARFLALKEAFDIDLREAYLRAQAASFGLKEIYGIDAPLPPLVDVGYLDQLANWARETTYKFEKKLFRVYETVVGFALRTGSAAAPLDLPRVLVDTEFEKARGAFMFRLPLKAMEDLFNRLELKMRNPRLRGIDVIAYASNEGTTLTQRYWRVRVDLPKQTIRGDSGHELPINPQVILPFVTYAAIRSSTSDYPTQRECHNVNPIGEWLILIEPHDWATGTPTDNKDHIHNLIVRMRVSYER